MSTATDRERIGTLFGHVNPEYGTLSLIAWPRQTLAHCPLIYWWIKNMRVIRCRIVVPYQPTRVPWKLAVATPSWQTEICPQAFRGPHVLVTTGTRDRYLDPILPYRSQCHTPWRTEGLLLVSGSSLIKNAHSRHDRVRICWRVSRRWSTHCHTNCLRKSHQVLARSVLFGCALELDASSDLLYNKPLLLSPALSAGPDTRLILC